MKLGRKQQAKEHCMEYLKSRDCADCFDAKEFERIYRTSPSYGNPFSVGLTAADALLYHAQNKKNEGRYQS